MRRGVGTVLADARRGDGAAACFHYTAATLATTDRLIAEAPQAAARAVRAIVATQRALRNDVSLATEVGRKLFPPPEAELIAELIARDLAFYDATLSREFVAGMGRFARDLGLIVADIPDEQVVAAEFSPLRSAAG